MADTRTAKELAARMDKETNLIVVRGGRTGRKIHLGNPGSSCLECGHWTKALVGAFKVRLTIVQAVEQVKVPRSGSPFLMSNLCRKCFDWAIWRLEREAREAVEPSQEPVEEEELEEEVPRCSGCGAELDEDLGGHCPGCGS